MTTHHPWLQKIPVRRLVPWTTALIALVVYVRTSHPGLAGGDSGELVAVAHDLGVAHPPGYPLYTLLGHVWQAALGPVDPARSLNLMSAVAQALASGVLAEAVLRWTGRPLAGLAAGLAWAFTAPVWKMALVAEVFALNGLLAATLVACLFALLVDTGDHGPAPPRRRAVWPWTAIFLVCGLLVAHHHTLVLLAVPVVVVASVRIARRTRGLVAPWRLVGHAVVGAAVGASPLLLLPIRARAGDVLAWGDPVDPRGFLHHLLRRDYGTLSLEPESSGLVADVSHVGLWLRSIPVESGAPAALLAAVGAAVLVRRAIAGPERTASQSMAAVVLGFLGLQAWFFTRVGFPAEPLYLGVVERFWVLPSMIVALLAGLGVARIADVAPRTVTAGVVAVSVLWPVVDHGRTVDQSKNSFVEDLIANVVASVPEGGALFVQGDLFHNGLAVVTRVRDRRPDLAWADQEILTYGWGVRRTRERHPGLLPEPLGRDDRYAGDDPASWNVHWFDHLHGRRPVAVVGVKEDSYAARYATVPRGLVSQVVPRDAVPTLERQARVALDLMGDLRWRSWYRRQDPRGFEAADRWRLDEFATRTCLLVSQPFARTWTCDGVPGIAVLEEFLDALVARPDAGSADLLRAAGLASVVGSELRDPVRARRLLEAFLRREASGDRADEARRVLRGL